MSQWIDRLVVLLVFSCLQCDSGDTTCYRKEDCQAGYECVNGICRLPEEAEGNSGTDGGEPNSLDDAGGALDSERDDFFFDEGRLFDSEPNSLDDAGGAGDSERGDFFFDEGQLFESEPGDFGEQPGQNDGDSTPPVRSNGSPSGTLPADTFVTTLGLDTNESSTCRASEVANTSYSLMPITFLTEDGFNHLAEVVGLDASTSYQFFVRCQDNAGNTNSDDFMIQFKTDAYLATPIFRSAGAGNTITNTGALASSPGPGEEMIELRVQRTAAIFNLVLPDRIGVGDMLEYDTDGDQIVDALGMITRRHDSMTYQIHATDGKAPKPLNGTTTKWSIFRAYNALTEASDGFVNQNIAESLRNFDGWNYPPPDLTSLQVTWNIACYADKTDTQPVSLSDWISDENHYLRVYTPYLPNEVGISQRHLGVWTDSAYTLSYGGDLSTVLLLHNIHTHVEGLQIDVVISESSSSAIGIDFGISGSLSDCIVRGHGDGRSGAAEHIGISFRGFSGSPRVWNNVVYGFRGSADIEAGMYFWGIIYAEAYNNTLVANTYGIGQGQESKDSKAVNNLFFNCDVPMQGSFVGGSDYNATDSYSLGYTVEGATNLHDRLSQIFCFASQGANDYHLTDQDLAARNFGTHLVDGLFDADIDAEKRVIPWDIGADEWMYSPVR